MAINKIVLNTDDGEQVLVDLTGDNVSADALVVGHTAHGADGEPVEGANPYELETTDAEVQTQSDLIEQIQTALVGKAAGGGEVVEPVIQSLEVTENGTYTAPEGVDGYSPVVVAVPEREITLQDKEITENGTYTADDGYDGLGAVTVNVAGGGAPNPREQYQRVEYIESAEDETYPYIITDFCGDNSSGLEVVASFPKMQDRIPMGSRENSDATRFYCVYPLSTSNIYYGFNSGVTVSCALKVDTIYRCQTNFLNSRLVNVYDENGIRKGGGSISATMTQQTAPVAIFGYTSGATGNVNSKREFKLYSARCSRGYEVVREYIPCYRKSDGVVGVLEKFTGQFLTTPTGAFAAGPDIDW